MQHFAVSINVARTPKVRNILICCSRHSTHSRVSLRYSFFEMEEGAGIEPAYAGISDIHSVSNGAPYHSANPPEVWRKQTESNHQVSCEVHLTSNEAGLPHAQCFPGGRAQRARMRAAKQNRNSLALQATRSIPRPFCACSLRQDLNLYAPCDARPVSNRVRYRSAHSSELLWQWERESNPRIPHQDGHGLANRHITGSVIPLHWWAGWASNPQAADFKSARYANSRHLPTLQLGTRRGIRTHTVLFLRQTPPAGWAIRVNLVRRG